MGSREDEQMAFARDGGELVGGSGQLWMYFKGKVDRISWGLGGMREEAENKERNLKSGVALWWDGEECEGGKSGRGLGSLGLNMLSLGYLLDTFGVNKIISV